MGRRSTSTVSDMALVAVFAGVIAVLTLTPAVPVGPLGVPITLQTLAVALTGMLLGPWRGFLAAGLYVLAGLAGLPIFAGGSAGFSVLARPSVGYLLAFPLAALLIGALARLVVARTRSVGARRWVLLFLAGLAGSLVVHALGIVGMSLTAGLGLSAAFVADLLYWPGDLIKNVIASGVAVAVHRAFPTLLARHASFADTRERVGA